MIKKIYILKIDAEQNKLKIPKIEYDVYYKENETYLVKLNLNHCKDCRTNILIPIEINESLDILNSSSGYYNDICYTAKSDSGADIIIKDRKDNFILNNKAVCQEDCIFTYYDKRAKKVKCSCKVKEPSPSSANMNIDINKIMKNFIDIKNIANIGLLICYKKLLSLKDIIKNIGFIMIILIVIFHLICIIIFYCKDSKKLKKKIKNIIFSKEISNLFEKQEYSKHKNNLSKYSNKNKKSYFKTSKINNIRKKRDNTAKILLTKNINSNNKKQKINQKKYNRGKFSLSSMVNLNRKNYKNKDLENNSKLKTIIKRIYRLKYGKNINEEKIK